MDKRAEHRVESPGPSQATHCVLWYQVNAVEQASLLSLPSKHFLLFQNHLTACHSLLRRPLILSRCTQGLGPQVLTGNIGGTSGKVC